MLDTVLGIKTEPENPQDEILKRYVAELGAIPAGPQAPNPGEGEAGAENAIEGLYQVWKRECRKVDQAIHRYAEATRALGSARDTGTGLLSALSRHDSALADLHAACSQNAAAMARLQKCTAT
jgi:hypothetical protein